MKQVEGLLRRLDSLEYLCISHKHLSSLYPEFGSEAVQQRIACFYMWRRALHLLNTSIYRLFQRLGARRQDYARLLMDFTKGTTREEHFTLDLCANDVADFEDNILIGRFVMSGEETTCGIYFLITKNFCVQ